MFSSLTIHERMKYKSLLGKLGFKHSLLFLKEPIFRFLVAVNKFIREFTVTEVHVSILFIFDFFFVFIAIALVVIIFVWNDLLARIHCYKLLLMQNGKFGGKLCSSTA